MQTPPSLLSYRQLRHDGPKLLINMSESWLLSWQGSSGKEGLQVHPLPLYGVEQQQALLKAAQACIPRGYFILETEHTLRV